VVTLQHIATHWNIPHLCNTLQQVRGIDPEQEVTVAFAIAKGHAPRSALKLQVSCNGPVTILPQEMHVFGNGYPALTGRLRTDCNKGYTAFDAWPCQACAPGFYKVCVAVCCSVLQCVAVCCSVLQCLQCEGYTAFDA